MLNKIKKYLIKKKMVFFLYYVSWLHKKSLKALKTRGRIRCVFFATFEETWKYDEIYKLMISHERFEPLIIVCPIVNYGYDNMLLRMNQCYNYFKNKDYNVLSAYDQSNGTYLDVRKSLSPDIILYTSPYKGLVDSRYYIDSYMDILSVYVPYFYNDTADYSLAYDVFLHNVVWRRYLETDMHKHMAVKFSKNKGRNVLVTGYPGIEKFLNNQEEYSGNNWKVCNKDLKRIIWAPHHSIFPTDTYKYASFLLYYNTMLELAQKYRHEVQFAFKPHPLLRNKLEKIWGMEKVEMYYNKWRQMPNTTVVEGDYVDLFGSSDAMIHDSGSFIAEYLYQNKPVIRTLNGEDLNKLHNKFGLCCLENHYLAHNAKELDQFIYNIVHGIDPLKKQRTKFINEVLMPKGSPSQNIINDILDSIDNQVLYRN